MKDKIFKIWGFSLYIILGLFVTLGWILIGLNSPLLDNTSIMNTIGVITVSMIGLFIFSLLIAYSKDILDF